MAVLRKRVDCVIDGTLQNTRANHKVEGMSFSQLIIDNLEDFSIATTRNYIFLQTTETVEQEVCYHLITLAAPYQAYWQDFVWIADFTKYVIHYLRVGSEKEELVGLQDFEIKFWIFVQDFYPRSDDVDEWHLLCGLATDFRKHVL